MGHWGWLRPGTAPKSVSFQAQSIHCKALLSFCLLLAAPRFCPQQARQAQCPGGSVGPQQTPDHASQTVWAECYPCLIPIPCPTPESPVTA